MHSLLTIGCYCAEFDFFNYFLRSSYLFPLILFLFSVLFLSSLSFSVLRLSLFSRSSYLIFTFSFPHHPFLLFHTFVFFSSASPCFIPSSFIPIFTSSLPIFPFLFLWPLLRISSSSPLYISSSFTYTFVPSFPINFFFSSVLPFFFSLPSHHRDVHHVVTLSQPLSWPYFLLAFI